MLIPGMAYGNGQDALCYNQSSLPRRYRLGVRTEDSQSSNPGSIPGSATSFHLSRLISAFLAETQRNPKNF
jgi:hypothetical protein